MKIEEEKEEVPIYGGVVLDDDEKAIPRSGPGFATYERVDDEKIEVEFEMATAKIHWDRLKEGMTKKKK